MPQSMNSPMGVTLPQLKATLDAFLSSQARFSVLKSFSVNSPLQQPPTSTTHKQPPGTLFILDSSFNPPTKAHMFMATSALRSAVLKNEMALENPSEQVQYCYSPPYRILLLFSVHNADKSPSPAVFEHRLAMMYLSALDIADDLTCPSTRVVGDRGSFRDLEDVRCLQVDVGLTKEPFYADKSATIDATTFYGSDVGNLQQHIHLVGYDTFIRLLDPKYYSANPPLSALSPFFGRHGLRIALRAADREEESRQKETWHSLRRGDLDSQGAKGEWAQKIEITELGKESVGVSSTAVRRACEHLDWNTAESLCTPRVTTWIRHQNIYVSESRDGGKV